MSNNTLHKLGIDIGSTTVKVAVLDENDNLLFSDYERHFANIRETLSLLVEKAYKQLGDMQIAPMITGSGGLTLAKHLDVPFVQEVISVSTALQHYAPQTDVAIELGGEDAKIIYFEGGNVEQRMNGICAGGTGSFIDQMASLIQTDATGLNEYAKNYKAIYPIAARYPASDQRRCNQGRLIRFHFPGSCQPDDQRSCLRQTDPWTRCFLRRSPALFIRVKGCIHPYLKLRRGACDHSFEFPSFCSDRFCTEL